MTFLLSRDTSIVEVSERGDDVKGMATNKDEALCIARCCILSKHLGCERFT